MHLCRLTFKHLPRLPSSKEQAAMRLCPKALGGFAQTAEIHRGGSVTCKSLPKHTCIRWQNNACTSLSNYTVTARYCSALTPRTQRVERVYLQATWWWPDWGRGVVYAFITQPWRRAFCLSELESAQCCENKESRQMKPHSTRNKHLKSIVLNA